MEQYAPSPTSYKRGHSHHLLYSGNFDYYSETMVGFFTCVRRIMPDPRVHVAIQILKMYKRVVRLDGYDIVVEGELQCQISNLL
jgi:hypothetical protein